MKRLILFLLAITLAFSLFSCDESKKGAPETPPDTDPEDERVSYNGKLFDNEMRFSFNGRHATLSITQIETLELDDGKIVSTILIANVTTAANKEGNGFSIDLTAEDSPYMVQLSAAGDGAEAHMAERRAHLLELVESDADKALVDELLTEGSIYFYHDSALTVLLFDIIGYDITLIDDTQFRFDECRYADGSRVVWEYYESGNVKNEKRYRADGELDYSNDFEDNSEIGA